MAVGTPAGEYLQASSLEFPAATTTAIFARTAFATALVIIGELPLKPRLILITQRYPGVFLQSFTAWSMPAMIPVTDPLPLTSNTLTEHKVQPVAMPLLLPHIVAATWVL